jgi:very-short-patch-repair endonuclease
VPFPSSSRRPEIDWSETVGSRRFPSTRFQEAAYWTETRDLSLAAAAANHGGVLTTSDLLTCGFSEPAIRTAVRRGLLTRWGRGVYIVGPLEDDLTQARAAAKAVPNGVLGFEVAAQLANIGPTASPPLSVIVPPDRRPGRPGVRIHRIALTKRDVTRREGLLVTAPDVTIVHLARTLAPLPHERAVQEAFAKRLTNQRELAAALDRHRGGRGTVRLKRMLELGIDDLRSRAERALKDWIRAAGLPLPTFNAEVGPWRVDALWRRHNLAVEINGYAAHSSPWAHDRDHRKEQFLRAAGLDVRRFTALQAIDEPALVIAGIAAGLAERRREAPTGIEPV